MLLVLIDLGGDQVASVDVAPAFEALDLPGMNKQVDYVRSIIATTFKARSANYVLEQGGSLRLLP